LSFDLKEFVSRQKQKLSQNQLKMISIVFKINFKIFPNDFVPFRSFFLSAKRKSNLNQTKTDENNDQIKKF